MSQETTKETQAFAPYNFIPISDKIHERYQDIAEIPSHETYDKSLKSGEIHVTLTADTPVMIGGAKNGQEIHFFQGANGKYQIPGSTIRGMLRENAQILSNSVFRAEDLEDSRIMYRVVASKTENEAQKALSKYYADVLAVRPRKGKDGKMKAYPENIAGGYVVKKGSKYYIYPVKGELLFVSYDHVFITRGGHQRDVAKTIPVVYREGKNKWVDDIYDEGDPRGQGLKQGLLFFGGKTIQAKNRRYLFPEIDWDGEEIELSDEDVLAYQEDWEARQNILGEHRNFWKLPEKDNIPKPVFYMKNPYHGHTYFGMSYFLRVGHEHTIKEGLPREHIEADTRENLYVDYNMALFGFARNDQESYKSRISVGDFPAQGNAKEEKGVMLTLASPKPSFYLGYLKDNKSYKDDNFELRGYKQYWLRDPNPAAMGKDNVDTKIFPLPKGTKFQGVIRFKNLHEDELGLLLWALELEGEKSYQSIGMGKPYGYGRMKVQIDRLQCWDFDQLYSLQAITSDAGVADETERIPDYKTAYDHYVKGDRKTSPMQHARIRDFFYIKSKIWGEKENAYMPLTEYRKYTDPMKTISDFIKEEKDKQKAAKEAEQAKEPEKPQTMEDWKKQLANKFNRR